LENEQAAVVTLLPILYNRGCRILSFILLRTARLQSTVIGFGHGFADDDEFAQMVLHDVIM
jgi:hypothetical protein